MLNGTVQRQGEVRQYTRTHDADGDGEREDTGWMGEPMAALAAEVRPSGQDTDDLDLVRGIRAGDDRAFELLYERYQPRIALYIRGMVQDHGRSEDITQEVFMAALRRMRDTDCEIVFKPWIYEIAKNACIDAFRRSRHTNEVSFDAHDGLRADDHGRLADVRATPDMAVDTKLDLDNLRGAFGGLSDTHHQILVMRELEGLSYRDIGERLGMSHPAVESTLFRARRRLEEEYGDLVSGKRCVRVRAIIDAGGRAPGVRDQHRLERHISHCQPCRRHALTAGMNLDARPARSSVAARIAALLPLPGLWRRAGAEDAPVQVLGSPGHATVAHWSANVASTVDPATLGGWGKGLFAAAAVAVAGVGADAAITERDAVRDFFSRAPALVGIGGMSGPGDRGDEGSAIRREDARSSKRTPNGDRDATTRPSGPSTIGGASGAGSSSVHDAAGRSEAISGAPGSPATSQPTGAEGSAGSASGGSGGVGGLLEETLDGNPGAGGPPSTNGTGHGASGAPSTLGDVADQVDGALSGVKRTAAVSSTGAGATTGPVQDVAPPVTSTVDATLGGI